MSKLAYFRHLYRIRRAHGIGRFVAACWALFDAQRPLPF